MQLLIKFAQQKNSKNNKDKPMKEVVIVSAVRTPMGSFGGSLSSLNAPSLGETVIKGDLTKAKINPDLVDEVYMGNVLQANLGQSS